MTRKKKFLIIARVIFMFFVVLGVAIVVALSKMDMNVLKSNLLGVLRSSTGLPIEITGDVTSSSCRLVILPTILMAIKSEDITEVYNTITKIANEVVK